MIGKGRRTTFNNVKIFLGQTQDCGKSNIRSVGRAKGKSNICKIFCVLVFLHPCSDTLLCYTYREVLLWYFQFTIYRLPSMCSKFRWAKSSICQYGLLSCSATPFIGFLMYWESNTRLQFQEDLLTWLLLLPWGDLLTYTGQYYTVKLSKCVNVCKFRSLRSLFWSA